MKHFYILLIVLIWSCETSDTANTNNAFVQEEQEQEQEQEVVKKLVETTSVRVSDGSETKTTYSYDENNRVVSEALYINGVINPLTGQSNYLYNSEGQIWKVTSDNNTSTEYEFSNDLIIASNSASLRNEYVYNSNNQIISNKGYLSNDILFSEVVYDYNEDENTVTETTTINGSSNVIIFEYDSQKNPRTYTFYNQIMNKIGVQSENNIIKIETTANSVSVITFDFTYDEHGYPLTAKEYRDGVLYAEGTYTYQD